MGRVKLLIMRPKEPDAKAPAALWRVAGNGWRVSRVEGCSGTWNMFRPFGQLAFMQTPMVDRRMHEVGHAERLRRCNEWRVAGSGC
jgi:hypothetical protein